MAPPGVGNRKRMIVHPFGFEKNNVQIQCSWGILKTSAASETPFDMQKCTKKQGGGEVGAANDDDIDEVGLICKPERGVFIKR